MLWAEPSPHKRSLLRHSHGARARSRPKRHDLSRARWIQASRRGNARRN